MGRAIEMGLRQRLMELQQQGYSRSAISQQLQLSCGTVSKLLAQLKTQGHLTVRYANCGPKQPLNERGIVRAALWLKRLHPLWGAPLIGCKLRERYSQQNIPQDRTLQRWFRCHGLNKPRQQTAQPHIGAAKTPHNIWQVDAKENLKLPNGIQACYLTITDEHSGAGLATAVFPPQPYLPSA